MGLVGDLEHPQAHQTRRPDGQVSFGFWEPGGLGNTVLVVTKDDHCWFSARALRLGLIRLVRCIVAGRLGQCLAGAWGRALRLVRRVFGPRNGEGGRSPLVRSAVLAGWSLLGEALGPLSVVAFA